MKIVTFAIPSYNAEKYLRKCLSSFCKQGTMDRIEVIIVNDGSTDSTEEIAGEFATQYPETFQVINKENGGHGSGINCAVQVAKGKFFKVVDADDWIFQENLERYLDALDHTNADAVLNAFQSIHMENGKVITYPLPESVPKNPVNMHQFMQIYPQIRDCCSFHGITYRTEMYRSVNFKLSEHIFYEDQEYASVFFTKVEQVLLLPFVLYQYLIGNGEQSIAYHNQVKRISHIETVLRHILDFWDAEGPFSAPVEELLLQKMSVFAASYYSVALVKNPNKKEGRKQAKAFSELLLKQKPQLFEHTAKKRKTMEIMNLLHMSPNLYQSLLATPFYRKIRDVWTK